LANWIEKNRDERQQDIKFVMTGWQSQRYEDLKNVDQRFAYLADNQIENNQAINQLIQSVGDDGSEQQPNDM
jgi:preprotein translocase subunit SecD